MRGHSGTATRARFEATPTSRRTATAAILHPDYPMLTPAAIRTVCGSISAATRWSRPSAMGHGLDRHRHGRRGIEVARTHDAAMRSWITAAAISGRAGLRDGRRTLAGRPWSLFMLAALVLLNRAIASPARVSFSPPQAWTKNEGQVFLLLSLFAMGVCVARARRHRPPSAVDAGTPARYQALYALAAFRWALPRAARTVGRSCRSNR